MKRILFSICLSVIMGANAQVSVKKSSISTGGDSHTTGNMKIVYAIGETAINEVDQSSIHVSEGFIGPDIFEALGITGYGTLSGISIYPNPVTDRFNVSLPQSGTYEFYLYNLQGKQILYRESRDINETFDISRLKTAGYVLIVIDKENKLKKSYKIIKN